MTTASWRIQGPLVKCLHTANVILEGIPRNLSITIGISDRTSLSAATEVIAGMVQTPIVKTAIQIIATRYQDKATRLIHRLLVNFKPLLKVLQGFGKVYLTTKAMHT